MQSRIPKWIDAEKFQQEYRELRVRYQALQDEVSRMETLVAEYGIELEQKQIAGGNLSGMSARDAAVTVLQEAGHPLALGELYEAVTSRGVRLKGDRSRAKNVLYGTIYSDDRLLRIGRGRGSKWGLVGRDENVLDETTGGVVQQIDVSRGDER